MRKTNLDEITMTEVIRTRCTPELAASFKQALANNHDTISVVLREFMENYIKRRDVE